MKINASPVLTTQNYGINYFDVDENFNQNPSFTAIKVDGDGYCNANKICLPNTPLCSESNKQLAKSKSNSTITIKQSLEKPIFVSFDCEDENLIHTTKFIINQNITRNVIIEYDSSNIKFINSFLQFDCQTNSQTNIVIFVNTKSCDVYSNIEVNLQENANLNITILMLDAKQYVLRQSSNSSNFSNYNIKCIYLGSNDNKIDLNIISNIFGKKAKSNIEVIGALSDKAIKNFKGTIDFKAGSAKSFGTENELCLLLSSTAKSKALPMILCGEEDVQGSHSSATGKIDNNQLFYIMSRGLSKKEAIKLITKAKFNSIIESIFDNKIKEKTIEIIDRKLDNET